MSGKTGLRISVVLICVNFVLFAVKLYVGLAVSSLSIYTDAMNNLLDSFTGAIALFGFFFLSYGKSKKYPFGLGRTEDIVSFVMSAVIIVAGCMFAYSSLERLMYPSPVAYTMKYVWLIILTAIVKLLLAVFLKIQLKKNDSAVIKGMYLDSVLDFFITFTVVLSFTVSVYTKITTDGIVGMIVSILIVISGFKLLFPSVVSLVGKRDDTLCNNAETFLSSVCDKINITQLQCHSYGKRKIFTVVITSSQVITAESICEITEKFNKEFGSEIYFTVNRI